MCLTAPPAEAPQWQEAFFRVSPAPAAVSMSVATCGTSNGQDKDIFLVLMHFQ